MLWQPLLSFEEIIPDQQQTLAFLQHIYRHLKPGGRAAVVLPDNVSFSSGGVKTRTVAAQHG